MLNTGVYPPKGIYPESSKEGWIINLSIPLIESIRKIFYFFDLKEMMTIMNMIVKQQLIKKENVKMKQCLSISALLLLVFAFCISGASAQPMDQGAGMQDDPPGQMNMKCDSMMHEGMMHEGMMHEGMMHEGTMHEGMMKQQHHMKMMLMRLGLDDKQKAEVDRIMTAHMKDVIKKKADLDIAKLELKSILSKDPMDMKAAESKLKEIESIKTAIFLAHLNVHQGIKSVLTPEQQTKMKNMMEMHMMGGGVMGKDGCGCDMMKGEMKGKDHCEHEKTMK